MGRKKKRMEGEMPEEAVKTSNLKNETISWLFAISFFVLFSFLMLSAFNKAGLVGLKVFTFFSILFGWGYFLLPIVCIILAIRMVRLADKHAGLVEYIGVVLFLLSSLALLDLIFTNKGGLVGSLLRRPLVALFDVYATAIILGAVCVIGILVILDTPINIRSLTNLFKKNKPEEGNDSKLMLGSEETLKIQKPIEASQNRDQAPQEIRKTAYNGDSEDLVIRKTLSLKPFTPPPLALLERDKGKPEVGDIKANANIIKRTLQNFGIIVEMDEISIGPSVTRYSLKPAEGVKLSKILGLQNNLELALAAHPVRIEAPIPGKSLVGIEIPNSVKTTVGLASLLSQPGYTDSDKPLLTALGKGISGESVFYNIAKMPHLLIAGATGSGKSVTIHAIINSLLFRNSPENMKFIMIDPKRVELTLYNKIPHLLTPVITDPKKTILSLKWAAKEMDRRYNILESYKVRDIESYHKNILSPAMERMKKGEKLEAPETMPYIMIVIDELADIMQAYPRELESAIVRLAQMSRAVGIHLILSTQRPSVNVITGLIKANIPARIALQVASQFDSRTILDSAGAEKLLGAGDMLYLSGEMSKPIRLQSPYISETEVKKVTDYLRKESEDDIPEEIDLTNESSRGSLLESMESGDESDDDLYEEARETVIRTGKASTSFLQRKLRIGYARAARLVDILEEKGVVSAGDGAKAREVLIKPEGGFESDPAEEEIRENELL